MKKTKLILAGMFVFSFLLLGISCDKKVAKPFVAPAAQNPIGCDTVTYTLHIKPILTVNCISCHNSSFQGADFTKYEDIKNKALTGKLKDRVIDGIPSIMPLGGPKLPQAQLEIIQCWINNGAKE